MTHPVTCLCFAKQPIKSKRALFNFLANTFAAATPGELPTSAAILQALHQRERLGCTALPHGIALPHARMDDLTHSIKIVVTLNDPITYDALDEHAIDIVVAFLFSQSDTERAKTELAEMVERLSHASTRDQLREHQQADQLLTLVHS